MWHAMFSAKLAEVSRISGISPEQLKPEFRAVHRRHGTSEYPFAIEELPALIAKHPGQDLRQLYDPAMHAYYSARKRALVLYPGTLEVLQTLRERGVRLIAYTESMAFYSAQRLITLGLDDLLEALYASGSDTLILPIQDLFGWRDRINQPATVADSNWTWRLPWPSDRMPTEAAAMEVAKQLREWCLRHRR